MAFGIEPSKEKNLEYDLQNTHLGDRHPLQAVQTETNAEFQVPPFRTLSTNPNQNYVRRFELQVFSLGLHQLRALQHLVR